MRRGERITNEELVLCQESHASLAAQLDSCTGEVGLFLAAIKLWHDDSADRTMNIPQIPLLTS